MPNLQSSDEKSDDEDEDDYEYNAWDFLSVGSVVAVAAHKSSQDIIWLIKITENNCFSHEIEKDSFGNTIVTGERFLKGNFLERSHTEKDHTLFQLNKLVTYFYKDTIIYPFVSLQETKKGIKLMNSDYLDINNYVESRGFRK